MANITLTQALTTADQSKIVRADLDCTVNYIAKISLSEHQNFNLGQLIFRYGQPGKIPNGKYGMVVYGDIGVRSRPIAKSMDHRVSFREPETPFHEVEYGSFHQFQSKITEYYERDQIELLNPKVWVAYHIAGLRKAIPTLLDWMVFTIFAGPEAKKLKGYTQRYGDKYINPSDGNTNGYKFYQSEAFGAINLSEVINKQKVTEHALHKKLDDLNKALRNESRKVEVDHTKPELFKTGWAKDNLTTDEKKAIALFLKLEEEIDAINVKGEMDIKYKHKSSSWEGYNMRMLPSDMVILVSDKWATTIARSGRLKEQFADKIGTSTISGVQVITSPIIDKDEAILMPRDLIRSHIMNVGPAYEVAPYTTERTRDYIYNLSLSMDLIDIYCSMWFKLKA